MNRSLKHEPEPLATLRTVESLVNSPGTPYDDLVKLATTICDTPIGWISLLDKDRQYFKARVGLDAIQNLRTSVFCVHAIQQDRVFLVRDACAELRFRQNELVTGEPFVRFYAGYALRDDTGEILGTLSVLDRKPRELRPDQLVALESLGRQVVAQIELQQKIKALEELRHTTMLSEAAIEESEGRFRLLVEGVRDHALFTIDHEGVVTSWNRGAERLIGYLEADMVGHNFSRLFTPEDISCGEPERLMFLARLSGRSQDEGWRIRADGNRFWACVNKTAFFDESGASRGFTVIMQDTTEKRMVTTALEETRQERIRLQDKLLSHVSHELRTPLTAIYFFTSNVADGIFGDLNSEQHEHLSFALENVKQLKEMVDDLLNITRVESHKLVVDPQHAHSVALITKVLSTCSQNATEKRVNLRAGASIIAGADDKDAFPAIWADPSRVRQILTNLVDNAIKFTPAEGTITVDVNVFPEDTNFLLFSVSDTGCGISPEHTDVVFERLAQIKGSSDKSRSGLGLGLFIARELVGQHGGRIWLESELGVGSTFYFTLPVFSITRLCSHVLTSENLISGYASLIVIDIVTSGSCRADMVPEFQKMLGTCIDPARDVILPWISDETQVMSYFIIATTGKAGAGAIVDRIRKGLEVIAELPTLHPRISSIVVPVEGTTPDQQAGQITTEKFEYLIACHLQRQEERA